MPSVADVLRQSGFSDEQIKGIDAKALSAFEGVLSTAEQERQAAELAQRSNRAFYEESIAPALTTWEEEKQRIESARAASAAEVAFYRTQAEEAKKAGFIPSDAPSFAGQPRDGQGRYVAGAPGATPGSPAFSPGVSMEAIEERLGNGISNVAWAMQEYQRLSGGQFLPDPFDKLAQEASNQRLPFRDYVARKYDFAGKQAEQQRKLQETHDAEIRREAETARDRLWAERTGNNPDVRPMVPSRYTDIARAVKSGQRQDPLTMNDSERRKTTSSMIRADIAGRDDAA